MPHSFHAQSAYASWPYVSHMVRIWNPFVSRQQGWTDALLLRKSALDSTSQPGWVDSGTRLCFSPNKIIGAVCLSQAPVDGRLLGLLGPYHQHANPSVLNRHRQVLQPWRCWLATSHCPDLSNQRSPTFHLRAPPSLGLSIQQLPVDLKREQTLHLTSESLHSTSTRI
jgi:hypothetical protein